MKNSEIESEIRRMFAENYELMRFEGGHALSTDVKETALNQVLFYWQKLRDVAENVTDTEVKLNLPEQTTSQGRKYGIEGIVDIIREDKITVIYDIRTDNSDYVRVNKAEYEKQLNVYAYIWQGLRGKELDRAAIIATSYPSPIRNALATNNEEQLVKELEIWNPLINIPFKQKSVEETIRDFGEAVDAIESREFAPPSVDKLNFFSSGKNNTFAVRVCRNCDARFSCSAYRSYVKSSAVKSDSMLKRYINDFGSSLERKNCMNCYPVILIPPQIQRVKSELPPKPVFSEPLPQQPGKEPKKINNTVIGIEAAAVTIPSIAMTSQGATVPGLLLFLTGAGAIAAHAWQQIKTYPKRKQKHRRKIAVYHEKLEVYDRKRRRHEKEVNASQHPERVVKFQYELLINILRQTVCHDGNDSNAPEGHSEAIFEGYLSQYFPGKIHTKLTLKIPNSDHSYTPDFAYIDNRLNLHIDIEIDEPYVYRTLQPTHCLYADKDRRRNNFFNDRGWIVIRFSEEQVIRHPHSCCKTIALQIAELTRNTSILNQFINIPDLLPQKQWTETEAVEMAEKRMRDNYAS